MKLLKNFLNLFAKISRKIRRIMRRGSNFFFDSVELLYYHLQKAILSRKGGPYIDSPKWSKNKNTTINPKNNDNNRFQYGLTVALNHQNIKNNPERVSKIKSIINQYDWKEIDFPSHKNDWKRFELNNKSIALNILFVTYNNEKIRLAYKSKQFQTEKSSGSLNLY